MSGVPLPHWRRCPAARGARRGDVGAAALAAPPAGAAAPAGLREGPRAGRALAARGAGAGPRLQLPRESGARAGAFNGRGRWRATGVGECYLAAAGW